jgi:UDP-3-O-[3-hydroxymyristoyl] N-acetylglucosamine deacetylase
VDAAAMQRQTSLCGPAGARVATIEHLLSACAGLGITNMLVELDGPEVPLLDGSARPFVELIGKAGVCQQPNAQVREFVIEQPVTFREGEVEIVALPDESTRFTYFADFLSPVGAQAFHYDLTADYANEVAPARTFVFEQEIEMLRKANLIRGGSLENALVITSTGYMNGPLRFDNEIARHKLLDLLGDVTLLGARIRGHVMAARSGHRTHLSFVKMLAERAQA